MKRRIGIGIELDELLRSLDETVEMLAERAGESPQLWAPTIDLVERTGETVVTVDLPGVEVERLSVAVDRTNLVISGTKTRGGEDSGRRYHQVERRFGPFEIVVALRREPVAGACRARYARGVLEVTVVYPSRARSTHEIPIEREVR